MAYTIHCACCDKESPPTPDDRLPFCWFWLNVETRIGSNPTQAIFNFRSYQDLPFCSEECLDMAIDYQRDMAKRQCDIAMGKTNPRPVVWKGTSDAFFTSES
jgi:hypothetical protein